MGFNIVFELYPLVRQYQLMPRGFTTSSTNVKDVGFPLHPTARRGITEILFKTTLNPTHPQKVTSHGQAGISNIEYIQYI